MYTRCENLGYFTALKAPFSDSLNAPIRATGTRPPAAAPAVHAAPPTPPVAASGDGVYITDDSGKRYLDASGGAAVSCLGHSHPVVLQAIRDQIDKISFAHTGFFTTQVGEDLAEKLAEKAPGDLNYVYFVSGGSEAVEAALKLARQYYLETGRPDRRHVITRRHVVTWRHVGTE